MKKQILTDNETKRFLEKTFKCTRQQVWKALNFERNSEQAQRMRRLALQRGGKLAGGHAAQCETIHNTAAGTMEQAFGPRVKIVVNFGGSEVTVLIDGQKKDSYSNMSVADFMQLQHEVEQMAEAL